MIDVHKVMVQRGAAATAEDEARRARAAKFARDGVLDRSTFVYPRDRAVRGERHDLSACVVREYERTGRPVPLSRDGVATAMTIKTDLAAVAITTLETRGLIAEQRNAFGGRAGYRPTLP